MADILMLPGLHIVRLAGRSVLEVPIIFKDPVYVAAGGPYGGDPAVASYLAASRVIGCKGEFEVVVELVQELFEVFDSAVYVVFRVKHVFHS